MALALAGRLGVTEPDVRSGAEAVLERGLRAIGMRGVGDRHRRQQDFQSQRQSEQHHRDRVASHPARFRLSPVNR